MNCEETQQLIFDFIDGELDADHTKQFLLHTEQCKQCQTELLALQQTVTHVTASKVPPPDDAFFNAFPDQVLNEFKAQQSHAQVERPIEEKLGLIQLLQNWWLGNSWPNLAAQAMLLFVTIGGTFFIVKEASTPSFDSAPLYAQVQNNPALLSYINENNLNTKANNFGFVDKPLTAISYTVGKLYSEALTMVAAEQYNAATEKVLNISQILDKQANAKLKEKLSNQAHALNNKTSKQQKIASLNTLHSQIKSLLRQNGDYHAILLLTGSWLVDLKVAATLGSYSYLQQTRQAQYIIDGISMSGTPKSIIKKLNRIKTIMHKDAILKSDAKEIKLLANELQLLLG